MRLQRIERNPLARGPHCCGKLNWQTARYIAKRPICKRLAEYLLDGTPMCAEHAGKQLLEASVESEPVGYTLEAAE